MFPWRKSGGKPHNAVLYCKSLGRRQEQERSESKCKVAHWLAALGCPREDHWLLDCADCRSDKPGGNTVPGKHASGEGRRGMCQPSLSSPVTVEAHSCAVCSAQLLSPAWFFSTPWTVAHQAPLSSGILQARILEWLPCPPLGDRPNPGIKLGSPAL